MNLNISKFIYKQGQKFNGGGNQSTQRKLAAGRWFSAGNPVSSTNKTDRQDITEILLKMALSTITLTLEGHIRQVGLYMHVFSDRLYLPCRDRFWYLYRLIIHNTSTTRTLF